MTLWMLGYLAVAVACAAVLLGAASLLGFWTVLITFPLGCAACAAYLERTTP